MAPICSSYLYPLCVYSENCKPAWECVTISNILQSIFTHFRCHPSKPLVNETSTTNPYPTISEPIFGERYHNANGDPQDTTQSSFERVQQSDEILIETGLPKDPPSVSEFGLSEYIKKAPLSPYDVESSSPSLKPATSGVRALDRYISNPGKITQDLGTSKDSAAMPTTGLALEQLFDSDIMGKFKSFHQNKASSHKNKKVGGGQSQIDWTGFGSIEPPPSGKSILLQLKSIPDTKLSDLQHQQHETIIANKPNASAVVESAGSKATDSLKRHSSSNMPGNQQTNGLARPGTLPGPKSKSHGKISLDTEEPKDQEQKLDSKISSKIITQSKLDSADSGTGVPFKDFESQSKSGSELLDFDSSESEETNTHQAENGAPNKGRTNQKPTGLVNSETVPQKDTTARHPGSSSDTEDGEHTDLVLGHHFQVGIGSSVPGGLQKNPDNNNEDLNEPTLPARDDSIGRKKG